LEICIKDLRDDFMKGAPIKIGKPVVSFTETVSLTMTEPCLSKSPNKHNRIYMTSEPLSEEFCKAMDDGELKPDEEMKTRAKKMSELGWDIADARKVWSFGCPPDGKANVLTDATKGVQYLNEIKDSMVGAFFQATAAGVLCEEPMRGIRFNLTDITMHADAIHRGAGQMMPCTKRVLYACQIKGGPAVLEPMYLVDITVPQSALAGVYSTLNARRGIVESMTDRSGTPLTQVKAFLPVLESFGFVNLLRANTSGQAFPQMIFSHWQVLNGSPYDEGSMANKVVLEVRTRKGLRTGMPDINEYLDKL